VNCVTFLVADRVGAENVTGGSFGSCSAVIFGLSLNDASTEFASLETTAEWSSRADLSCAQSRQSAQPVAGELGRL